MGRSVNEWNTNDVFQRKYNESWVIFETPGGLVQEYVVMAEAGHFFHTKKGIVTYLPVYFPFESGYYLSAKDEPLLLERKFTPHKSWKIGMGHENWNLYKINGSTGEPIKTGISGETYLDLLGPPDRKRFLSRNFGVPNRKYYLSPTQVFFKGHQIGSREGKIILLDNRYFMKDLTETLGPEWQIS